MKRTIYSIFFILLLSCSMSCGDENSFSEITKIALRDVGNSLLLSQNDSTSLVLPITNIDTNKFELTFQEELSIVPDSLVDAVKNSFAKANLPDNYRIEVLHCSDNEVAYSYEMKNEEQNSIIPCMGRALPVGCYIIQVQFTELKQTSWVIYVLLFGGVILALWFLMKLRKPKLKEDTLESYIIGKYEFYPDQNKLVKSASEIQLSKKECELLEIFYENLNTVVKRDELVKRVWEDQGVFVGRSLDTYISKLRKKLQEDDSIKITNIHGVGYKLEVLDS
ncbi:winged helix family transcriptional regulator [Meridianimaribacter sp. CL38]|uniref:winged helix-turn-helix domain-containing protein n=1 Tax=Meridianimaribacter sp. CL38 TaxID=2213021 RepID=UPI00103E04DD|nr:winged helix-turn-helix domain-containing protein [Meridianimaribacter sp. CL38]TBV28159.1 winged helix family transcriptional regulator [Meridianimaribacter sp. CL38]